MSISFFNSLNKKLETFLPIDSEKVGIYHCGPTVYDDVHIGNLRAFLLADIVRRCLEWNNYSVTQVMNITDVGHLSSDGDHGEDKMTKALIREGRKISLESMLEVGAFYQNRFVNDLRALNIKLPHHMPKASEHIDADIKIIQTLEAKGFTYNTIDSVYFDTSKYPDYGQLGLPPIDQSQSRTGVDDQKKNPRDFALWKKHPELGCERPWGLGFPGWHIECSGMSTTYLGTHIDVHTGGIDLQPTHHNNEIAQSVCCYDKPFVNYWLHNEHLDLKGEKMSKSTGNFLTLNHLIEQGFSALDYRYWLLQSHYRSKTKFTYESLKAAQTARRRLKSYLANTSPKESLNNNDEKMFLDTFTSAINHDLSTPQAISVMWEVAKSQTLSDAQKSLLLEKMDEFMGILADKVKITTQAIPEEVRLWVIAREQARKASDWKTADHYRKKIQTSGYEVKDTTKGPEIYLDN